MREYGVVQGARILTPFPGILQRSDTQTDTHTPIRRGGRENKQQPDTSPRGPADPRTVIIFLRRFIISFLCRYTLRHKTKTRIRGSQCLILIRYRAVWNT